MDGRDLVRSVKAVGSGGAAQGLRTRAGRVAQEAYRRHRVGAAGGGAGTGARAGAGAVRGRGGGVVRFARAELRITVAVTGAVFWGWDGAGPEPSYALAGRCPDRSRAALEPDKDGGWRVVAERVTVVVSRHGGGRGADPRRGDPAP